MKKFIARYQKKEIPVEIEKGKDDILRIRSENREWSLDVHSAGPNHYSIIHEGKSYDLRFFHDKDTTYAFYHGERITFNLTDAKKIAQKSERETSSAVQQTQGPVELRAIMPGKIAGVKVNVGDEVSEGQGIVVLEAMKMENEMVSPKAGTVREIRVKLGQSVESGAVMAIIE